MNRNIRYALHEDGYCISRSGNELAWPILEYEKIGSGGDFTQPLEYHLDSIPLHQAVGEWPLLKWTKKVPIPVKNQHRTFWGMKPLPVR